MRTKKIEYYFRVNDELNVISKKEYLEKRELIVMVLGYVHEELRKNGRIMHVDKEDEPVFDFIDCLISFACKIVVEDTLGFKKKSEGTKQGKVYKYGKNGIYGELNNGK